MKAAVRVTTVIYAPRMSFIKLARHQYGATRKDENSSCFMDSRMLVCMGFLFGCLLQKVGLVLAILGLSRVTLA